MISTEQWLLAMATYIIAEISVGNADNLETANKAL